MMAAGALAPGTSGSSRTTGSAHRPAPPEEEAEGLCRQHAHVVRAVVAQALRGPQHAQQARLPRQQLHQVLAHQADAAKQVLQQLRLAVQAWGGGRQGGGQGS